MEKENEEHNNFLTKKNENVSNGNNNNNIIKKENKNKDIGNNDIYLYYHLYIKKIIIQEII